MSGIHIEVLRFARDNPGFSLNQLKAQFPKDFSWIYREIQHSRLFQSEDVGDHNRYHLSFDDCARLLEYEELSEARVSSKRAMAVAIASILITLLMSIYQVATTARVKVVNFPEATVQTFNKPVQPNADAPAD